MRRSTFLLRQAAKGLYKLPLLEVARWSPRFIGVVPIRPIRALINVTHNCNSRCITCYHWKEESRDELTVAELSDVLCQLKALGIADLCLSGGEPLLRDDLADIVHKASDLKFDRIHVMTNGLLLTRERLERLVKSGITSIYVSLNGSQNVHDMTRGMRGAYARTMDALKTLVELRNSSFPHLEINVQTVLMGLTVGEVIDLADICRRWSMGLSLSPLTISRPWNTTVSTDLRSMNQEQLDKMVRELHNIKWAYPSSIRASHASLEYIRHYFADQKREDIPCYLGYLVVGVGPHGEVFPGCWSLPPVGNLMEASLKQITGSKAYRERVRDMFLKRCPGCACDYTLNLYAHFPSIVEEIRWRLRLA